MGGKSSKPKDKSKPAGNKNDKKKSIPVLTDDAINLILTQKRLIGNKFCR